jgi:O-acetyl-ADP-ribose deacetylase
VVGPVWQGGTRNEDELLAACYRNALVLAEAHDRYRFPSERGARIAIAETLRFLARSGTIAQVFFVCFDDAALGAYRPILADY